MTVRPGGHEFVPGALTVHGSDGRRYVLCDECGRSRRAAPHQPVDPRSTHKAPAPPPPAPVVREPREVVMLRLAAEAVLDLPAGSVGYTLRMRAADVRRATLLPPDEAPTPHVNGAPPSRTTRPSQKGTARWVRRAIPGAYWDIASAALDEGFTPVRTGNGHIRFERNGHAFSLSTTVKEGRGHGLDNARAAARRAGVTC